MRSFLFLLSIFYVSQFSLLLGGQRALANEPGEEVSKDNFNVLPVPVLFFTPETGTGAGGGVYITYDGDDGLDQANTDQAKNVQNLLVPFFVYTEKNQAVARLYWDLWSIDQKTRLYSVLGYTNYPDSFFGVGNNTKRTDEEMFREIYSAADFDFERQLVKNTFIGVNLRSDTFEILEKKADGKLANKKSFAKETDSESRDILGTSSGSIRGVGLQLRYLSTNHPFTPTDGYNIILRNIEHGGIFGGHFRYSAQELRLKRYFLVMGKNSLALEILIQRSIGSVPFRKLPMLGGQYLLRGFFLGRFRDNALQTIQTEYRHILTEKVGINLFLSEGAVGESLQEVSKKASHVTGGIGFRYIIVKESNLGLRLDIARTSEETSIYFGAGEAF
jgi:hypothetical protein